MGDVAYVTNGYAGETKFSYTVLYPASPLCFARLNPSEQRILNLNGSLGHVCDQVKIDELQLKEESSFRSARANDEDGKDDQDEVMAKISHILQEENAHLNSKEKELLKSKEQLLMSQEDIDKKKHRRSHLQDATYPEGVSPFVSNDLEKCDENTPRCADCFGIEKADELQTIGHDLSVVSRVGLSPSSDVVCLN